MNIFNQDLQMSYQFTKYDNASINLDSTTNGNNGIPSNSLILNVYLFFIINYYYDQVGSATLNGNAFVQINDSFLFKDPSLNRGITLTIKFRSSNSTGSQTIFHRLGNVCKLGKIYRFKF